MSRIYPLFSSSKGNAAFLGNETGGILIDCGVSAKRLKTAMARAGLPMDAVRGIFITHDHADHIAGLRVLCKQISVPVFAQEKTMQHLIDDETFPVHTELNILNGETELFGMTVLPFDTPHDTVQSCGFRVTMKDGRTCAVCTDLGHVTETVSQAVCGCDLVLLEANYDPAMLRYGSYPESLKARIRSDRGHLSNEDAAAFADTLVRSGTKHLILGHLSQHNNTPERAVETVLAGLSAFRRNEDFTLRAAAPESDGRAIAF